MFSISHYWAIQIRNHLRAANAGFWKEKKSLILSSSIQISAFFRYYPVNNVTSLYNTFKHVVLKDVVLDIVAGAYENSMQVRFQTVLTNAYAYCLATLGPFAVTLPNEMHSLFWLCLNSVRWVLHSFCCIHFVSRKSCNLSGLLCPTSIK